MNSIIKRPLITEKSMTLATKGWYTFEVAPDANKDQISKEIHQAFSVDVIEIRTISVHGKTRRVGRKQKVVKQSDRKKALVKLKEGQKIEAFELPQQES